MLPVFALPSAVSIPAGLLTATAALPGLGLPLAQEQGLLFWVTLVFPLLILFYLMLYRPQKQQQDERQKLLSNLKKNDRVVTIGGIHGIVARVNNDQGVVDLKLGDNSGAEITVDLSAVSRVITPESKEKT